MAERCCTWGRASFAKKCIKLALATAFISVSANGAALVWDASGNNPGNPQPGDGNWDTTTSANWSNGSTDRVWANGSQAFFGTNSLSPAPPLGTTITIDDKGGTVTALEIYFYVSNYTIAAISGDCLTMVGAAVINGPGTISAPIVGTGGIYKDASGNLTLTGQNSYSGSTQIGQSALILANGASLGNTSIFW
jgi:fibronectin-binding autotransporter adhesin